MTENPTFVLFISEVAVAKLSHPGNACGKACLICDSGSVVILNLDAEWLRVATLKFQILTANQTAMATSAATIAHHITGVRRFELPLRGESLAAWLNSCFI